MSKVRPKGITIESVVYPNESVAMRVMVSRETIGAYDAGRLLPFGCRKPESTHDAAARAVVRLEIARLHAAFPRFAAVWAADKGGDALDAAGLGMYVLAREK